MATASPIVSKQEILQAVADGTLSIDEALKLFPQKAPTNLRCKVSDKGGVSLYGVNNRFPVTLYAEQWERVLGYADDIRAFIKAQNGSLKRKAS